jgi:hypothetical protein
MEFSPINLGTDETEPIAVARPIQEWPRKSAVGFALGMRHPFLRCSRFPRGSNTRPI